MIKVNYVDLIEEAKSKKQKDIDKNCTKNGKTAKKNMKVMSKTKIYECAHFEYEYDDLGKYAWCHNCDSGHRECPSDYIYGMQFCPFYKQGKLRAEREVTEYENACALKFKSKMEAELHKRQNEALEACVRLNKYKKC